MNQSLIVLINVNDLPSSSPSLSPSHPPEWIRPQSMGAGRRPPTSDPPPLRPPQLFVALGSFAPSAPVPKGDSLPGPHPGQSLTLIALPSLRADRRQPQRPFRWRKFPSDVKGLRVCLQGRDPPGRLRRRRG